MEQPWSGVLPIFFAVLYQNNSTAEKTETGGRPEVRIYKRKILREKLSKHAFGHVKKRKFQEKEKKMQTNKKKYVIYQEKKASFKNLFLFFYKFPPQKYSNMAVELIERTGSKSYRVFVKCCFFPKNVVIFLNSASPAAALVFYLPFSGSSMNSGVHTEEKPREARVRNIF